MDPITTLITTLQKALPQLDQSAAPQIRQVMDKFALVPKHEYEAHIQILRTLEAQVRELEAQVAELQAKADQP